MAKYTSADTPDWLNGTSLTSDPCQPDLRVTTQVKDYNSLPGRFKDFLLLVDQSHICKDPPYLLLAIKSLAPDFDRRQAIGQSRGRSGVLANRTAVTASPCWKTPERWSAARICPGSALKNCC